MWRENERFNLAKQHKSPDFRWARVSPPHPRILDRYVNVQPWNNNRVKLRVPKGHVDYVNASPIALKSSARLATGDAQARGEGSRKTAGQGPDRYIAMQGPKQQSTNHVWRMVVEQLESPAVIVMLTETHEGGQEKCWPYFPSSKEDAPLEINELDEFGDGFRATLRCEGIEDTTAGGAIELRKLVIRVHSRPKPSAHVAQTRNVGLGVNARQNGAVTPDQTSDDDDDIKMKSPITEIRPEVSKAAGISDRVTTPDSTEGTAESRTRSQGKPEEKEVEERVVWHFLYKKWPDFGVPDLDDLESFFTLMRLSREKNADPHNPRIVHCSAGVGRSGTFIALEHLMHELDAGILEHYDERASKVPSPDHDTGDSATGLAKSEEAEDLIFATVNQLREQRCTMVQSMAQYQFIYEVMRKLWRDKYGEEEVGEPAAKRLEVDPFVEG